VATKQITVERFKIASAKPFAEVVRAIEAQVGHPDIKQFYEAIHEAEDEHELQRVVNDAIGPSDLMEFMRFDQGAVLRRTTKTDVPRIAGPFAYCASCASRANSCNSTAFRSETAQ